ncbi:insulin-like growth factor II [Osmerus mordax]|uniref:insulin-like growth factor II n=1 Tax=Osmerus mordax TaxID=8014 RepID=UPI0035104B4E
MSSSSLVPVFALTMTLYIVEMASAETLCGGELVDVLQFVCKARGFHFSRPGRASNKRSQNQGIVEECCFRGCDLNLLEQYCAKSERYVSASSLQVIPVMPVLKQEVLKKHHVSSNYKYINWQRKAAQRLRRIVPSILRTRKFRLQGDQVFANEEFMFHAPMMTLLNMTIFSSKNNSNYATVKLSKLRSCYYTVGMKRSTDDVTGSPEKKKLNADDELSIFDSYFESD